MPSFKDNMTITGLSPYTLNNIFFCGNDDDGDNDDINFCYK